MTGRSALPPDVMAWEYTKQQAPAALRADSVLLTEIGERALSAAQRTNGNRP